MQIKEIKLENINLKKTDFLLKTKTTSKKKIENNIYDFVILIQSEEEKYQIFEGFEQCFNSSKTSISSLIIDLSEYKLLTLIQSKIENYLNSNDLSYYYLSRFLIQFNLSETDIPTLNCYLKTIKFPELKVIYADHKLINEHESILSKFIDIAAINSHQINEIRKFNRDELNSISNYFEGFELSGSKLSSLFEIIRELKIGFKYPIKELFKSDFFNRIKDHDISNQKYNIIKEELLKLRYPMLNEQTQSWLKSTKNIDLPFKIKIETPKYFEENEISIHLKSSSLQELNKISQKLSESTAKNAEWGKLFEQL